MHPHSYLVHGLVALLCRVIIPLDPLEFSNTILCSLLLLFEEMGDTSFTFLRRLDAVVLGAGVTLDDLDTQWVVTPCIGGCFLVFGAPDGKEDSMVVLRRENPVDSSPR